MVSTVEPDGNAYSNNRKEREDPPDECRGSRSKGHAEPQLDSSAVIRDPVRTAANSLARPRSHRESHFGEAAGRRKPRRYANHFGWCRRLLEGDGANRRYWPG